MTDANLLLTVRFDGESIGPARIPVAHLQTFLTALNRVLRRTANVLQDGRASVRRGPSPQALRQEVELSLVVLTHGSDAAVLGFDRNQTSPSLPGMDLGLEAISKAVQGLVSVQAAGENEIIQSVERLDGPENVALKVRGGKSFWDSLSLEQLARSQDVGPMKNVEALFHTWPGDDDDGFEEAVNELRHQVPLVSHNAKHFKEIASLSLITGWRESSA